MSCALPEALAEYLRLRARKLKAAAPYSDETMALRTVVRTCGDLAEMRVAATNRLSAPPDARRPGARAIFADVESGVSLEFLTRYPTPAAAAHRGGKRNLDRSAAAHLGEHDDARASGKDHPHAIRVLVRAWIRVIWRCWLDGVPYDPATNGAAAALAEQSIKQIAA